MNGNPFCNTRFNVDDECGIVIININGFEALIVFMHGQRGIKYSRDSSL